MRDIKFRMWSAEINAYFDDSTRNGIIQAMDCLAQQVTDEWDHEKDGMVFEQYTGLRDTNGNEIYEGDILKHQDFGGANVSYFKIVYDANYLSFVGLNDNNEMVKHWNTNDVVVVGNIHENPELLKV